MERNLISNFTAGEVKKSHAEFFEISSTIFDIR